MKYSNTTGISVSAAVWLATDNYDYNSDPYVLSVTTLLKPIRQIILSKRAAAIAEREPIDIASVIASRMGSAIHDSIERTWTQENAVRALKSLNYSQNFIDNLLVNPKPEDIKPTSKVVYVEQRHEMKLGKYTISGKFDLVMLGQVEDWKSTSVYVYMNQTNLDKYVMQGSLYRMIVPEKITSDLMNVHYIFTDWQKSMAMRDPKYPASRLLTQTAPLHSVEEAKKFALGKIALIEYYKNTDQDLIPECTSEELWRKDPVYKYYSKADAVKASKVFKTQQEANKYLAEKGGIGFIKAFQSEVKACLYCSALPICNQAQKLIECGDLTIEE